MNANEILTVNETKEFLRIDYDDSVLDGLIEVSFDIVSDAIDDFKEKLISHKFKRKLKLCMLSTIANMYDNRDLTTDKEDRLRFVNQVMLFQLKYCDYTEFDE